MKFRQSWAAVGMLAAAGLIRQSKKNASEWVRIQTAIVYLKGVEIVRDLFLYQLGVLICVMFLVFGVILMEGGTVFFLPLQPGERASLTLLLGTVDFFGALGFLVYFCSSGRWLRKAQKYHAFLDEFMEETKSSFENANGERKKHRN